MFSTSVLHYQHQNGTGITEARNLDYKTIFGIGGTGPKLICWSDERDRHVSVLGTWAVDAPVTGSNWNLAFPHRFALVYKDYSAVVPSHTLVSQHVARRLQPSPNGVSNSRPSYNGSSFQHQLSSKQRLSCSQGTLIAMVEGISQQRITFYYDR